MNSLAESFGYRPWAPDLIVVMEHRYLWLLERSLREGNSIKHLDVLVYIDPRPEPNRITQKSMLMCVCFIQYYATARIHRDIDKYPKGMLSTSQVYAAETIIRLAGDEIHYLKDRAGYAGSATPEQAVQIFNADMNKWLKLAMQR